MKETLNKNSRLDRNAPQEPRPPLEAVIEEIQRTRTKHNKHQNDEEDSFKKKTPQDFTFLGLNINRDSGATIVHVNIVQVYFLPSYNCPSLWLS